ncbi:MAG: protein FxsA [Actinomycetota bacterium]|jgi:UPF0716 protein FxsA|nr:protein FxsA [Actinomycetota bacterium]MDQ1640767.1 protein FxsA [Actinomycetota bacterium]
MGVVLIVAFLIVPIAEIYVIVQVGQQIGALPTIALLLVESAIGAWLVKREGRRAWRALRDAVGTGRLPSRELSDAALVLVGGTLLLTPGFLTDVVGFFFILPVTRPLARRMLAGIVARRAGRMVSRRVGPLPPRGGRTVPGEVVRDPRDPGAPGPTGPDRAR